MGRPKGAGVCVCASLSEMLLIGTVVLLVSTTTCIASNNGRQMEMSTLYNDDQEDGTDLGSGESGTDSGDHSSVDVTSWLRVSSDAGASSKFSVATSTVYENNEPAVEFALQESQKDPNSPALTIVAVIVCIAVVVVVVVVVVITVVVKRKRGFLSITRSKDVLTNDIDVYPRQYARIPPGTSEITGVTNFYSSASSHGTCNPMYDDM